MKKTIPLLLTILAINCAPTYLLRKIDKSILAEKNLIVMPFKNCQIAYQGNVENEFGKGSKEELIQKYLQTEIPRVLGMASCFKKVDVCSSVEESGFDYGYVKTSDDTITIMKPGQGITLDKCASDIVLYIDNVKLSSATIVNIVYFVPVVTRTLSFTCDYTYWDTKTNAAIASGKVREQDDSSLPVLTIHNWKELVEDIVDELLVEDAYKR